MLKKELKAFSGLKPEPILQKFRADGILCDLPIDLNIIIEKMGIEVSEKVDFDLIEQDVEGRAFVENGLPKIWINPFLNKNRKRFTLAHEIGHVVRDILPALEKREKNIEFQDFGGTLSFNHDGFGGSEEYFANDFAGRLLMPKTDVVNVLKELLDNKNNKNETVEFFIKELAEEFEISRQAMTIRLLRLKLIR